MFVSYLCSFASERLAKSWRSLRKRVPQEYTLDGWPVTRWLIITIALGAPTVRVAMGYTFLNYQEFAWPLSPVLHRDALHLGANVLMLGVLGPVEARMRRREFTGLAFVSAYLSVLFGALWSLTFTEKEFVAFYGISETVFAMAGDRLVGE